MNNTEKSTSRSAGATPDGKAASPAARHFLFGNAFMLMAAIFWGVNIPVTKALIVPGYMTADDISATRLVGGCLLFWLTSFFFKCEPIARKDWLKIFLGGAIGLFTFIYLFILSLRYGSAIDISIIMTLPPMFVILMGVLFEHRRPALMEYAGVAISFAGAVIVILAGSNSGNEAKNILLGDALALLSAMCFAFYLVILEKPSHEYRPLSLLRWVFLFGALPGLFLLPGMKNIGLWQAESCVPWLEVLFILFCPTFLAYFLVQPAVKNIGSEMSSLYQYLVPVVAAVCAVLMHVDSLSWPQVIAMCVIVAGMVMTNMGKKKRAAKTPG